MWLGLVLNYWPSCVHLPSAGITWVIPRLGLYLFVHLFIYSNSGLNWYWCSNSGLCACEGSTSTTSATPPAHFAVVVLEMGSHIYSLADLGPLPIVARMTGAYCYTQPFPLRWCSWMFLLRLAWNHHPPDLSLLCSWDNKCTLLCPAIGWDTVL
jgi:hypothetical protein